MKNIRFYTIAVLFADLLTPKRYRCLCFIGSYKHRKGPKGTKKDRKDTGKDRKDTEKDHNDTEKDTCTYLILERRLYRFVSE